MGNEIIYALCFYAAAAVAVASAFMVVWHKNPVINALFLVVCFFAVAVVYVLLQAHFVAAIQVLLYAGAVLVLFLMIIMLMDLSEKDLGGARPTLGKAVGLAAMFGVVLMLVTVVSSLRVKAEKVATREEVAAFLISQGAHPSEFTVKVPGRPLTDLEVVLVAKSLLTTFQDSEARSWVVLPKDFATLPEYKREELRKKLLGGLEGAKKLTDLEVPMGFSEYRAEDLRDFLAAVGRGRIRQFEEYGTTAAVGRLLFGKYILPFEAASILLLGAIIGVLVLSRRGLKGDR